MRLTEIIKLKTQFLEEIRTAISLGIQLYQRIGRCLSSDAVCRRIDLFRKVFTLKVLKN